MILHASMKAPYDNCDPAWHKFWNQAKHLGDGIP